ncbi:hypothetical protein CAAN1_07S01090 [[Candida] anglica]|uniref:Uncharacterized protein n=1 Tax=[Candida] anglica TaxID=148631 RepID=A0ABP0ECP9_9ASCO
MAETLEEWGYNKPYGLIYICIQFSYVSVSLQGQRFYILFRVFAILLLIIYKKKKKRFLFPLFYKYKRIQERLKGEAICWLLGSLSEFSAECPRTATYHTGKDYNMVMTE